MPNRIALQGEFVRLDPLEAFHVNDLVLAASEDRSTYAFALVPTNGRSMLDYVMIALEDERSGLALPFVIRLTVDDRVVGSTRFLDLDYLTHPPCRPSSEDQERPRVAEIGSTWLAAAAQRTQVNTEAKLLMLRHAFDDWEVERVTFKTDARNSRSRRAIERIGARFEGIRRVHLLATDGTIRDSAYFSIIREEWPDVRENLVARLRRTEVEDLAT